MQVIPARDWPSAPPWACARSGGPPRSGEAAAAAVAAAVNCAAAAVYSGQARCVVVYRGLSEGTDGRGAFNKGHMGHLYTAHGMLAPAQVCALRTQRMLEVDRVPAPHSKRWHWPATTTPRTTRGRWPTAIPLDHDRYQGSRLISEPLRLFDCSRENDGAAAILVVAADRVGDYRGRPAYILSGVQGAAAGWTESVENEDRYTSAGFHPALVARLWDGAQITPRMSTSPRCTRTSPGRR